MKVMSKKLLGTILPVHHAKREKRLSQRMLGTITVLFNIHPAKQNESQE
jgi:hypothetical protein